MLTLCIRDERKSSPTILMLSFLRDVPLKTTNTLRLKTSHYATTERPSPVPTLVSATKTISVPVRGKIQDWKNRNLDNTL
jgi:hypothetical protein